MMERNLDVVYIIYTNIYYIYNMYTKQMLWNIRNYFFVTFITSYMHLLYIINFVLIERGKVVILLNYMLRI